VIITGILLAAGAGSRFGGGKLLAEVPPGTPMCVSACRNLMQAVDEVIAVVRPNDDAVRGALEEVGARIVLCARAHEGMGASLACGVGAAPQAQGWIVALADMPLIQASTIALIARALRESAPLAAPVYRGERGHPVGFAASLRDELLACSGDAGARSVIKSHAAEMRLITTADAGVLADIDTRAEFAAARDWALEKKAR
jgi:molybdenum cofactor cytidylyltransferase